ncbi:MAG: FtsW/RodA/SpoVE family cell cycle protein [Ferruginibacter sp.]
MPNGSEVHFRACMHIQLQVLFSFTLAVNICVTIGLAPVIGITLPLMSYGGSSLITFTALIFIQ